MDKTAEQSYRDDEWLVKQLRAWPERVDMGKTTSITYLMQSAADEIDRLAALSARPAVGEDVVERVAEAIWKRRQQIAWEGGEQPVPWHYAPTSKKFLVREDARVAIAAMGGEGHG